MKYFFFLLCLMLVVQARADNCPKTGDARDATRQALNVLKNRDTEPTTVDPSVTLRRMLNSQDDPAAFNESNAVSVSGYLLKAKSEGGESCNCHASDDAHHDIHVFIAPTKAVTSIGECVVVELTPWTRAQHPEWTVAYLNSLKGTKVQITGWLLYDIEHKNMSAAWNPDNPDPKRGTVWEVHPITGIDILEDVPTEAVYDGGTMDDERGGYETIIPTSGPLLTPTPPASKTPKSPQQVLVIILLGALLGATGQGIRVVIGLKKLQDSSLSKAEFDSQFDVKRLVLSVVYGITVGIVAGIIMAVKNMDGDWSQTPTILAVIAAGYAGADFIKGFMSKYLPDQTGSAKTSSAAPPATGAILQK